MKHYLLQLILVVVPFLFLTCKSGNNSPSGRQDTQDGPRVKLSRLIVDPHNPRHIADTAGNPILLIGDSPQNLPQRLTIEEMRTYFDDCRTKGINLCWVCIDGQPTASAEKYAPVDRKGNPEFLPGGNPENWDVSRVNPAYFEQTLDSILILAEDYGIYINLMPMSQCYWSQENITANSPENCFKYGVFLGNRYKNTRNLLWIFGNDNMDTSRQCPIVRGILSTGDNHLKSVHIFNPRLWGPDPQNDARGQSGNFFKHLPNSTMGWISYNNLYSDMEVFNQSHFIYNEYKKKNIMPILMTEGPYQKLAAFKWQVATNQVERGLNYRVALGGGFGGAYTYGCEWLQNSADPWDKYLNKGARPHIKHFSELFRNRPWWNLKPDWDHEFLTATSLKGGLQIENDNYTIAAYDTVSGKLGIIYCTVAQTVTVDLSGMAEPVAVKWYDPTTGKYTGTDQPSYPNKGIQKFTTPDKVHREINTDDSAETSSDWVLVVEG